MRYDQVAVQMPGGGYNVLAPDQFERMALSERIRLVMAGKVQFLRAGTVIPVREALDGARGA